MALHLATGALMPAPTAGLPGFKPHASHPHERMRSAGRSAGAARDALSDGGPSARTHHLSPTEAHAPVPNRRSERGSLATAGGKR